MEATTVGNCSSGPPGNPGHCVNLFLTVLLHE